jgi:hypothetical protein
MKVISKFGHLLNLDRANYLNIERSIREAHKDFLVCAHYDDDYEIIKDFDKEKEAYLFLRELAKWMLEGHVTSIPCFRIEDDENSTSTQANQGHVEELATGQ